MQVIIKGLKTLNHFVNDELLFEKEIDLVKLFKTTKDGKNMLRKDKFVELINNDTTLTLVNGKSVVIDKNKSKEKLTLLLNASTPEEVKNIIMKSGRYIEFLVGTDGKNYKITDFLHDAKLIGSNSKLLRGAITTSDNENLTLEYLKYYIQYNKFPHDIEINDESWISTYENTATTIVDFFKNKGFKYKNFEWFREGGFMEFITNKVRSLGISQKDSWDPADIWGVINFSKATKEISELTSIEQLNIYLSNAYISGAIVGISLKKLAGKGKLEEFNINHTDNVKYSLDRIVMSCAIDKHKNTFNDAVRSTINDNYVTGAIRQFPTAPNTSIQMEFAPKRNAKAQLGKVPKALMDKLFKEHGGFVPSWKDVPKTKEEWEVQKDKYLQMLQTIEQINIEVDLGNNDGTKINSKMAIENISYLFSNADSKYLIAEVSAKLQSIIVIYSIINSGDKDEIFTKLVYLAMKSGTMFGPFLKIS